MKNKYTAGEFAKLIGVSVSTLQRWDRNGLLVADRTPTNQRQYSKKHLDILPEIKESVPEVNSLSSDDMKVLFEYLLNELKNPNSEFVSLIKEIKAL